MKFNKIDREIDSNCIENCRVVISDKILSTICQLEPHFLVVNFVIEFYNKFHKFHSNFEVKSLSKLYYGCKLQAMQVAKAENNFVARSCSSIVGSVLGESQT